MLVQTIQSDFIEGTNDIIQTMKKLLDFPIQPCKRIYIQDTFGENKPQEITQSIKQSERTGYLNGSTFPIRKSTRVDKKNKSINKKPQVKDKRTDKEKEQDRKVKMYTDHIISNQKLNGLKVNLYGNTRFLKFVVGKGNNSLLARVALKTRWWWSETKKNGDNSCTLKHNKNLNKNPFNFIWTQWKMNKVVNNLPKHCEESELKASELKDDTTKHSDTDEMVSTTQSINDAMATPKSSRIKRLNSDSASRKINTPETISRSDSKYKLASKTENIDVMEPVDTESTVICNHVEGHVHLSNK